jgi:hypothetical protein
MEAKMKDEEKIKLLEKQIELLEKVVELQEKVTERVVFVPVPSVPSMPVYPTYPQPWIAPYYGAGTPLWDYIRVTSSTFTVDDITKLGSFTAS